MLIQSARLDAQEEVNTQMTALAQRIIEEQIDKKRFFWLNQQMRCAQLLTEVDP